jgi:uncharacterized protein with HEPN domain
MKTNDIQILEHILDYCLEINETVQTFGDTLDIFQRNKDYQLSIIFTIIQIGELANKLSEEFIIETKDKIPWNLIIITRNRYVHGYSTLNFSLVWYSALMDLPILEAFCKDKLKELEALKVNNKPLSATTTTDSTPDSDPDPAPTPRFKP